MSDRPRLKKLLIFAARLLVSVLLLVLILKLVGTKDLGQAFAQCRISTLLLFFPIFAVIGVIGAVRWRLLLACQKIDISLWEAFKLSLLGLFYNNVMPGLTGGDILKAAYATLHTSHRTRAVLSVIVDRLIGLIALGLIALVALFVGHGQPMTRKALPIVVALLAVCTGICVLFMTGRAWGMDRLARRFPLGGISEELLQARDFYANRKGVLFAALFLSILAHFAMITVYHGYGLSLGIVEMGFADYLVAVPTINFLGSLPISIMGWGVTEAGCSWLLASKGVAAESAVALSIMVKVSLTVWSIPGGFIALFYRARRRDKEAET